MQEIFLCLSPLEEHFAPADRELMPKVILKGTLPVDAKQGRNSVILSPSQYSITEVSYKDCQGIWFTSLLEQPFEWSFSALDQQDVLCEKLISALEVPQSELEGLYPFILIMSAASELRLYHHLARGETGDHLYVAYDVHSPITDALTGADLEQHIAKSQAAWDIARSSFNHGCWYSKWRSDVEIERKYTFSEPIDTWKYIQLLYQKIKGGQYKGFIPEFNDEFQVWDFENYMFEILEPEEQIGYISFIPQSNGLMTVKQKKFKEDTEIRTETITAHVPLRTEDMISYAAKLGTVCALPGYRRKRFDVNLESLETGNIYGIFFDLCRPFNDEKHALYQCEVEYIRSRVMAPIDKVMEEYEQVCAFTKDFLIEYELSFNEGYYSKLSYLRDYRSESMKIGG